MKTVKIMISIILLAAFLMALPFSICSCTKSRKDDDNNKDDNNADDPQNGPDRDYYVTGLKTDGYKDNMYSGTAPTLSWRAESGRRGARQSEYRILIAEKEEDLIAGGKNVVWDSGTVKSDAQNVTYSGAPLAYEHNYVWKVIVTDELGIKHDSETGSFNTELDPEKPFGGAEWIRADAGFAETDSYTVEARIKIVSNSSGLVFSATDSNNFYLWQLSSAVRPGKIVFRPHKWQNGSISVITEVDVSRYMSAGEGFDGWHVMKVEVEKREFRTYIDGELVYTLTDNSPLPFGSLGIRNVQSADDSQVTHYDYITLTDTRSGAVIQSEDFSSDDETELAFNCGSVKNGIYIVRGNQLSFYSKTSDRSDVSWFRKEFESEKPVRAILSATALGVYELYINGRIVGEDHLDPGWTDYYLINNGRLDPGNLFYQTFDVTDMISAGNNTIGAILGTGWYNGKLSTFGSKVYGEDNYLIVKLVLEFADGKKTVLSDGSWKCSRNGPIRYSDLENGEVYDARLEFGSWNENGFDDEAWNKVSTGSNAYGGNIIKQAGETAKIVDAVPAVSVTKHKNGNYIVDLGQEITGWIYLKNVAGTAGSRICMRFGEMLNSDGTVYRDNLRTAKATDYYTFKGGADESWRPSFTFRGFRYVEIEGYEGELKPENVTGEVLSADVERTGSFKTSDEKVNKLYENIFWSQIDNFLSVPMGCPQRDERLGWTGDINVFALTSAYNSNSLEFLKKFNFDLQNAQEKTGEYTDIAPRAILRGEAAAGWADTGIIIPYVCYRQFGDISAAAEFWDNMEKFMSFLDSKYGSGKTRGTKYVRSALRYGDHLNVGSVTAYDLIGTAYYAYDAKLMSEMAEALGKNAQAASYRELYEKIRKVYIDTFVTDEGRVYGAGSEPTGYDRETQTGYVLSLYMDLVPEELRANAAGYLVEAIRKKDMHLTTGFMGISMLLPVLTASGYVDVAYELLLQESYPSWLYSVNNGATTIWERWNSWTEQNGFADISMNSFNHYALGSVGEWLYSGIGGISQGEEAGYREFLIEPHISEKLGYAETTYVSSCGAIVSNWSTGNGTVAYSISVPANSSATVRLEYRGDPSLITESGIPAAEAEGVSFVNAENGVAEFRLLSGSYSFSAPLDPVVS